MLQLVHVPIVSGRLMQSLVNVLNSLYAQFIGLLFWLFCPKQETPIIEPEPAEPAEPAEPDFPIFTNNSVFGFTITDGWDNPN
jgi:hypothetical protein